MKFHDNVSTDALIEATLRDVVTGFAVSVMHFSVGEQRALDESGLFFQSAGLLHLTEAGRNASEQLTDEAEHFRYRE